MLSNKLKLHGIGMTSAPDDENCHPTRGEVAEYVHDLAGQLAKLAQGAGLLAAAKALRRAQTAVEEEF
jgi:hypothetical protein